MTKEKILGIDMCAGPHWREFHLTISYYMVSFGERESMIWDSLFYYVKEILVKGLFHDQKDSRCLSCHLPWNFYHR